MDWYDHYKAIESCLEGFVFWVHTLPKWGMAALILILSGLSSKLGLIADIACGVIVWNVFGTPWGLLFFGASVLCWIFSIWIASLD